MINVSLQSYMRSIYGPEFSDCDIEVAALQRCRSVELPYSLKFSRIKHFEVLPNSAQKQIFMDKIFVVMVPVMHYIYYELEISREKIFTAIH